MKKITFTIVALLAIVACKNKSEIISEKIIKTNEVVKYPSDILPFMDEWKSFKVTVRSMTH